VCAWGRYGGAGGEKKVAEVCAWGRYGGAGGEKRVPMCAPGGATGVQGVCIRYSGCVELKKIIGCQF